MSDGQSAIPIMRKKGVALAIVSGRCATPLEMVTAIALQSWPTNTNFRISNIYGKPIELGRIAAVKDALEAKSKYLWLIDDDTVPPPDAGRRLIYLLEQFGPPYGKVMIAAGVYTTRGTPPEPLVYMEQGGGPYWDWKVGQTFKAWGAGTGCMMINTEIFSLIEEPWFQWTQEIDKKESDDLYFCAKVAEAGYELMIHGGVLCHHYDMDRGIVYQLPRGSKPYLERIAEPTEPRLPMAVNTASQASAYDIEHNPWMSVEETNWLIEQAKKSERFVEVGAWKGITTRNVAKNAPGCRVIAIDTFQGSSEHLNPSSPNYEPRLKDPEWLFKEMQRNVQGLNNVEIAQMTSAAAANGGLNLPKADCETVFIDASHDYHDVKKDINWWLSHVKQGGTLCGHDFNWEGVNRAVKELLPGAINIPGTSIWAYRVGGQNG